MIAEDFDLAAVHYDQEFTHSGVGIAQRNQVWRHLDKIIQENETCLELNCGTGEDALLLSQRGVRVIATDISPKMVNITKQKIEDYHQSQSKILDINELGQDLLKELGVLFSNFGGLNCLSPKDWGVLGGKIQRDLPSGSKIAFVIMSKKCLWERIYFALKKNKKWDRNTTEPVEAHVSGNLVKTWYYSPKDIKELLPSNVKFVKQKPIGFFVPPSYFETFFKKKKGLLKLLVALDIVTPFSFLSNYADHFYIEFEKLKHG